MRLNGETYISLPMESIFFGEGYVLRSLQSVDSVSGPVQKILRNVFLIAAIAALLAGMFLSVLSSRSIVRPIAGVVSHLRESEKTGLLPEFHGKLAPIHELRDLTESFNRAATAIREARESLHQAYVEFVGSLASALDARDRYTAGHSRRVSEYSCAIGQAMEVSDQELDQIRMGALLHDIGKIGIADSVLQKPGALTKEERLLIEQHPIIGRRILEGVNGFHAYLPAVELHHENWDGSGYPLGLRGAATPLSARIVHVADAYDAMTSDRPYRRGMSHEEAVRVLEQYAGTQFDAAIVPVFTNLAELARTERKPAGANSVQVRSLAGALNGGTAAAPQRSPEAKSA
jgi:HD-GYP domain-containing protein (c-di-GMP phosphodiesterase class II)